MRKLCLTKSLLALSLAGFGLACGTTEPEASDPVIAIGSGNGQTATAGTELPDPVRVRVTVDGIGVPGTTVAWSVTSGGGSVDPASSVTDNTGQATASWTLGVDPGANALQASSAGATGSPVTFAATGTDPTPPNQANVTVQDNFFTPESATVAAGGSVTWTWAGSVGHNVTFPTGAISSTQSTGTFSRDFPTAGSFDYVCTIHAGMAGTVIVQ